MMRLSARGEAEFVGERLEHGRSLVGDGRGDALSRKGVGVGSPGLSERTNAVPSSMPEDEAPRWFRSADSTSFHRAPAPQ